MVSRGFQDLPLLACSFLLSPQAAEENGGPPVSVLMAAGQGTRVQGTHPAAGTWRAGVRSATVALPFASLAVGPGTPAGTSLSLVAESRMPQQVLRVGSLVPGGSSSGCRSVALCVSVRGPLRPSLADPGRWVRAVLLHPWECWEAGPPAVPKLSIQAFLSGEGLMS